MNPSAPGNPSAGPGHDTDLLAQAARGDAAARDALFARCYPELKRLARMRLTQGARSATLDTTALVHDVYLKLTAMGDFPASSRIHFLGYAARTMRSVIIDLVRARVADRRGGGAAHVTLDTDLGERLGTGPGDTDVLDVHRALDRLGEVDPRLVQVVEMRFFAGFSEPEVAEALGVTIRTVARDWKRAKTLLAALIAEP
ncbi:MAG: hypothetical protein JNK75_02010 [Betaproteobacteria bacterium]|nr:hypothetical protein [Betaproteobacteria bacterium]